MIRPTRASALRPNIHSRSSELSRKTLMLTPSPNSTSSSISSASCIDIITPKAPPTYSQEDYEENQIQKELVANRTDFTTEIQSYHNTIKDVIYERSVPITENKSGKALLPKAKRERLHRVLIKYTKAVLKQFCEQKNESLPFLNSPPTLSPKGAQIRLVDYPAESIRRIETLEASIQQLKAENGNLLLQRDDLKELTLRLEENLALHATRSENLLEAERQIQALKEQLLDSKNRETAIQEQFLETLSTLEGTRTQCELLKTPKFPSYAQNTSGKPHSQDQSTQATPTIDIAKDLQNKLSRHSDQLVGAQAEVKKLKAEIQSLTEGKVIVKDTDKELQDKLRRETRRLKEALIEIDDLIKENNRVVKIANTTEGTLSKARQ